MPRRTVDSFEGSTAPSFLQEIEEGRFTGSQPSASANQDETTSSRDHRIHPHDDHRSLIRAWDFDNLHGEDSMERDLEEFLFHSLAAEDGIQPNGGSQSKLESSVKPSENDLGSVFETSFDLTEDRLKRLFQLFDGDGSGLISYDELKLGLQYHSSLGTSQLTDKAFERLVSYLDSDESGDINFEEFSEGIRLLMLRSTLQQSERNKDMVLTEVFDYDSTTLRRYVLEGIGQVKDTRLSTSVQSQSLVDFFLLHRTSEVAVRWINITGKRASNIMKMMALKYRLHPLALEDALDSKNQRPKADSYDGHYFLIAPVFYLKKPDDDGKVLKRTNAKRTNWFYRFFHTDKKNDCDSATVDMMTPPTSGEYHGDDEEIGVDMTSIFITKPHGNTVITFNSEQPAEESWRKLRAELKKSYSRLRQYDGQYLAYSMLDRAVDKIGPIVKRMKKIINEEKATLAEEHYKNLDRIHSLKHQLRSMSRRFKPFLRLLVHVIEDPSFSPGATIYLRDVLDNLEIYDEDIKDLISMCESVDQEAENFQARQMDTTLYTLTVISATFLPAQFFTGVWGMNFQNMPELQTNWGYFMFWIVAVTSMLLTITLLNFGRRR